MVDILQALKVMKALQELLATPFPEIIISAMKMSALLLQQEGLVFLQKSIPGFRNLFQNPWVLSLVTYLECCEGAQEGMEFEATHVEMFQLEPLLQLLLKVTTIP